MDRWAEYFESQFSNDVCLQQTNTPDPIPSSTWTVSSEPPTEIEVKEAVNRLKLNRAAGPDDLPPILFKNGNTALLATITRLFENIWQSESVPKCWGESIVIPIFKKGKKLYVTITVVSV